ncbi:hypothetical protein RDV78_05810 [Bacillota bacterium LX-D]|nr:hypothetical protein [Bacillota bacterium LX-D]
MEIFFNTLLLIIGLLITLLIGVKGFMINSLLLLVIILSNNNFVPLVFILNFFILVLAAIISLALDKYSRRKFDPLPIREIIIGSSALGITIGMLFSPIWLGEIFALFMGTPLLRRYALLGRKAILLTCAGWLIRNFTIWVLTIWHIVELI